MLMASRLGITAIQVDTAERADSALATTVSLCFDLLILLMRLYWSYGREPNLMSS